MSASKVFHKSIRGASHIASGKPCQDVSLTYENDDVQIVVVCDGHGGSTYFRSDIGARIAAQSTIECLQNFARSNDASIFEGKSFSITAKPKRNPFIDADGNRVRYEELDDTQKQYARQAQSYVESEGKFPEEQKLISELISQIYTIWRCGIEEDVYNHPFNKKERVVLDGIDIAKAYGCTLLAFLKTPSYWLAFQIGDGSVLVCDKTLVWTKPIPEDCSCFLNYTTSLCDSTPLMEFRYAFSGEGKAPFAIMVCSDGVDGSLRTANNLHDFFEQVIGLFLDDDNVEKELDSYLPQLSESGNHDDMSLAGIVDLRDISITEIKKVMEIKNKERSIQNEYRTRKNEIDVLNSKLDTLIYKLERQKDAHFIIQSELDEIRRGVQAKEHECEEVSLSISSIKGNIEILKNTIEKKRDELESWKFTIKNEMAELESVQSEDNRSENNTQDYTNW